MSISIDKIGGGGLGKVTQRVTTEKVGTQERKVKQFDELLISGERGVSEDKKASDQLSNKIKLAVRQSTDTERVESLRARVSSGSYEVNIEQLADSIMRLSGSR